MTTNFPTSLDTTAVLANAIAAGDARTTASPAANPNDSHHAQHNNHSDSILALEAKVGIDSTVVTTSIDYLLKNVASNNPGHTHSGSSVVGYIPNSILVATGDMIYASAASTPATLSFSAPGANLLNVLGVANGNTIPAWKALFDTTVGTTLTDTAAAGTSVTGARVDHAHSGVSYALLAGRSGGQTLIGGTGSGDDLTLKSSSHATRGTIFLGNAGTIVIDDVNNRVGIGTATPSVGLEIAGERVIASGTVTDQSVVTLSGTIAGTQGEMAFLRITGTVTAATGDNVSGIRNDVTHNPSSSVATRFGSRYLPNFTPTTGVTITNSIGHEIVILSGSGGGAITTAIGYNCYQIYGSVKPTNSYGMKIGNMGSGSVNLACGLSITKPTSASNNFYFEFDTADATAAGTYHGRLPVRYNGLLKYIHIFNA